MALFPDLWVASSEVLRLAVVGLVVVLARKDWGSFGLVHWS